jgi:hypothetical protein
MKTKRILIAITIAIFTSVNFFANAMTTNGDNNSDSTKNRMNIRVNSNNQVVLRAACSQDHKWVNLVVKVYSEKGSMVFAESIHKKGGVYKGFDMSTLPEGRYSFEVYKNLKKVYSKDVVKSTQVVTDEVSSNKILVQLVD